MGEEIPMHSQPNALQTLSLGMLIELSHHEGLKKRMVSKQDAQRLAKVLNQSLINAYPELRSVCVLTMGALYDQSQIVRANFPIYEALRNIAYSANKGHVFKAQCIAVGGDNDLSVSILNPEAIQTSPLLILPILLVGHTEDILRLTQRLETDLMQTVEIDLSLKTLIEQLFEIKVSNVSMATLSDMVGMLASQLIQIGLEPIWHLIKSAVFHLEDDYLACLETGQRLFWDANQKQVRVFQCDAEVYAKSDQAKSQSFDQYQQINGRIHTLLSQYQIDSLPLVFNQVSFLNISPTLAIAQRYIDQQFKKL